jgi:demethylspheroidene O-methyltransferase
MPGGSGPGAALSGSSASHSASYSESLPTPPRTSSRESLLDALRRRRDRLLADARFQRFATAFALTRPIARARSRDLFDLCAGFVYSQVLYACVTLGLLRRLLEQPQSAAELAQALALPIDRLQRLLSAAQALGLVEQRGGARIGLGVLGAALLGNPGVEAMIRHHELLYADLADPVALLRGTGAPAGLSAFWGYAASADPAALSAEAVAPYTRLMSESQQFVADIVLAAYPFARHRRLLDVGGGDGTFALAAARKLPGLQVGLFDLPGVASQARIRFQAAGLGERASVHGGSFFSDPVPGGADLVTLVRVVHDHDDDKVRALLANLRRTMRPEAVLLIAEPMAGEIGNAPMADGYFGFYLMAMGSGRARSVAELRALLHEAGFGAVERRRTRNPLLATIVTARPRGT